MVYRQLFKQARPLRTNEQSPLVSGYQGHSATALLGAEAECHVGEMAHGNKEYSLSLGSWGRQVGS